MRAFKNLYECLFLKDVNVYVTEISITTQADIGMFKVTIKSLN